MVDRNHSRGDTDTKTSDDTTDDESVNVRRCTAQSGADHEQKSRRKIDIFRVVESIDLAEW